MPERPTLLHRMALVSFLLFRKNLGKLREFFGQIVYRPPWQKIACTPMAGQIFEQTKTSTDAPIVYTGPAKRTFLTGKVCKCKFLT